MKFVKTLLYAGLVATASAHEPLTPDKAEADIKTDQLRNVLWNLNKIANDNGGNRAFGTPGYNASLDFVLERAVKRFGKHMDTYVQPFDHLFHQVRKIEVKGPGGENVYVISLLYNPATPLPGGITAELVTIPVDDARGTGCFEDQWAKIDVKGKIPLVKRGTCAFADKVKLAKTHGAVAVMFYNDAPGKAYGSATLSAVNVGKLVPSGLIPLEDGQAWIKRLAAGEKLSVTLIVDSLAETRPSWNIISETKEGDPNNVVMLGAHLDSVLAGPGVNDDGSGTAALLEIMGSFKKYKGFKNKVRFAWWGAEESGLIGSLYYGSKLTEAEADKIRFYFNYDMIGSINPFYAVYADSDAHKVGANPLMEYLKGKGKPADVRKFGTSSDYVAFLKLGIPSSGIFTGAGAPTDPCYHLACDTIDNINWDAFTVNAKAAARAAAQFALSLDGVPPRVKTSINPRSKQGIRRTFDTWADTLKVVEKTHNCGSGESTI
ncbi:hypothetical protein QQS21_000572 [Conoideocrella luteorostrata]|uniref:Peptide hydrolase n=1 Tax=Conoideocrella luteorostrata TaxID=1105319 RepID=A0AAJ0D1N1_9HYPO|nr:hypothetical protein QQS21_000572 [Conoideocrella luteorostrata]